MLVTKVSFLPCDVGWGKDYVVLWGIMRENLTQTHRKN